MAKGHARAAALIKPHHLVDIITSLGDGKTEYAPHPYGHALHTVAAGILANPDAVVELTPGADDICAPCIYNVKGVCGDTIDTSYRPKAPPRKQDWNALIDRRWFSRLKLNAGDRLTAREFCARLQAESADLTDIYPEIPADHIRDRARKLLEGIRRFAGLGGSPLAQ